MYIAQAVSDWALQRFVTLQQTAADPAASRLQFAVAATILILHRASKRALRVIVQSSALERQANSGAAALTVQDGKYEKWMARRAVWRVSSELSLSSMLQEQARTIERFASSSSVMTASDLARSITLAICRRKDIAFNSRAHFFLEKYAIRQIVLVKSFETELSNMCSQRADWVPLTPNQENRSSAEMFNELWDAVHAASTWPASLPPLLSRESRGGVNWVTLGFQGLDPSDDLRGSGRFGLVAFHNLLTRHSERAARLIVESKAPDIHIDMVKVAWYPAALASIHVCAYIARLSASGSLRKWLFFSASDPDESNSWQLILNLHAYIIFEFHEFWKADVRRGVVKTVMNFEVCFANFCSILYKKLVVYRPNPLELDEYSVRISASDFQKNTNNSINVHRNGMYLVRPVPFGIQAFEAYFEIVEEEDRMLIALKDSDDSMDQMFTCEEDNDYYDGKDGDEYEMDNLSKVKVKEKSA